MKPRTLLKLLASLAIAFSAAALGGFFTAPAVSPATGAPGWYAALAKPALNPPSWVFAPVWTALYALIGVALFLVWRRDWKVVHQFRGRLSGRAASGAGAGRRAWNPWSQRFWSGDWQTANIIAIFALQWVLNVAWSFVFFGLHQPGVAFFVIIALWCSIVYLIINFYRVSRAAAWLLAPYLLWVSFAAYLNLGIWLGN
jgi:tryptophan-rich sensory protein